MEKNINIEWNNISLYNKNQDNFISLADMIKFKKTKHTDLIISRWLSRKYTTMFAWLWKQLNNKNFNVTEFRNIKNESKKKILEILQQ